MLCSVCGLRHIHRSTATPKATRTAAFESHSVASDALATMPVFHTKTIEAILEPVAQQVSRLVIIHEDGEAGHAMPDLSRPVSAVSLAVTNLIEVGKEMATTTEDQMLKQSMPVALDKVDEASRLLETASRLSTIDPYSPEARHKLIEGSRSILQGTSNVLLAFDQSEVRKILRQCQRVLDYLVVAEVIDNIDDLVHFVQDISPSLSKVTGEVLKRAEELTHTVHRSALAKSVEQLQTLAPILVCSMKIFVQITQQKGKGLDEASENRNYLTSRMMEELHEMMRVLQLTSSFDESLEAPDTIGALRKYESVVNSNKPTATDWIKDSGAKGGVGVKCLRRLLEHGLKVADLVLPADSDQIAKVVGDLNENVESLVQMRNSGQQNSPQALNKARETEQMLEQLTKLVHGAVHNVELSGLQQPASTLGARLEQVRRWLDQVDVDDGNLGREALRLVLNEAREVAEVLDSNRRTAMKSLCDKIERESAHLAPNNSEGAKNMQRRLEALSKLMNEALVERVVNELADIGTPLKHLINAAVATNNNDNNDELEERAKDVEGLSRRVAATARLVANAGSDRRGGAQLIHIHADQLESLTPQLLNAARIRRSYPDNKAADDHFENLRAQYGDCLSKLRGHCDEAIDAQLFIAHSLSAMKRRSDAAAVAVANKNNKAMVEHASNVAKMANRVAMITNREADNSEDKGFSSQLQAKAVTVQQGIPPMVDAAKKLAMNITDVAAAKSFESSNKKLLEQVRDVQQVMSAYSDRLNAAVAPPRPPLPDLSTLNMNNPPPRPPFPDSSDLDGRAADILDTTTDDEGELFFHNHNPSQGPIMLAARDLHDEVRQWSSKDNNIIGAAKRMALLMAQLSELVDSSNKRVLIDTAKAIADASEHVTRIAKELAAECTDRRMRTALLQVCERIPTISTQLKILSTVKATLLGSQASEEDMEATEMLVGNAQNLMHAVKLTVTAAEAASIKIRTDAGITLKWVRKHPWYQA